MGAGEGLLADTGGRRDRRTGMSTQIDDLRAWTQLRMRQRGLSHAQLALRCGLDRSTITRFLRGERSPKLEVATRIMDALYDTSCVSPHDQMRGLLAGPERVEAALRSDPLLHPTHVEVLMRLYAERRAAPAIAPRDDRHRSAIAAPVTQIPDSAGTEVGQPTPHQGDSIQ